MSRPSYAELHCKSNFSFLEGASHPQELVETAARLGYGALAITDRNSLAGVVRAHTAAKAVGLPLLVGAEITPSDVAPLVLLATDRPAYGRLARLITLGRRRAEKGQCELSLADVAEHSAGLVAGVICGQFPPPPGTNVPAPPSAVPSPVREGREGEGLADELARYRDIFGDRCYALAELHRGPADAALLDQWIRASRRARVPLAAANDVHYHEPGRQDLQDVLTAIRHGVPVNQVRQHFFSNRERHLRPVEEISDVFGRVPEALERTLAIAGDCTFSLDELRYEYPEALCPPDQRPIEYLCRLTWQGAQERYPAGVPPRVGQLIEHELRIIEELRYEAYFLTVWDLVRFARSRGILCQGRGSAANSVVCYCLGVTAVDPERIDVLFERFVSRERNEAPDIDVDFEHERREEVLQYLYDKYGRERAGIAAEVITYRPRSAVRDVGKALGLPLDRIDALAKGVDGFGDEDRLAERCHEVGLDPQSPACQRFLDLVERIQGFPRHLSQHVGGMVITRGPLCELVPIENAAMPGRTVIQWDKNDLDDLGILKVDCLALGMLTALRKCFDLVERHQGRRLTLATVPAEDPAVYAMASRADTVGVFQIESRAQMSMLPRLRPRCFYDLVIAVALVRPGPIQGDMVHPYLRRRDGIEPVDYPNAALAAVLEKTLGVPLFQEQAMRLAVVAAGFTPDAADRLRRAMGAWRRAGVLDLFRQQLIDGMTARGLSAEYAGRLYRQISGFGEYGFPESHAASFALLVYVSAWLKRYYPAAFTAALLNSQPMGFYAPAQLVADARKHGVPVLGVDVSHSDWDATLEPSRDGPETGTGSPMLREPRSVGNRYGVPVPVSGEPLSHSPALRLGLRMISGLSRKHTEQIVEARRAGPFRSLPDFGRRTRLGKVVIGRLARADAFGSLGLGRRQALWEAAEQEPSLPLFGDLHEEAEPVALPPMAPIEEVAADYRSTGLSLRTHPLAFLRRRLDQIRAVRAADLSQIPHGSPLQIAGLAILRQQPSTAKGIRFITLEDETGIANLVVRPAVWDRYHRAGQKGTVLLAQGRLERHGDVIHVVTSELADLTSWLSEAAR